MMQVRGIAARAAVGCDGVGRCGRPIGPDGREVVGVRTLLEWAFARECATLDFDEVGEATGGRRAGVGVEARIADQLALGRRRGEGVRVDTSIGRSLPHDDAELVATVLRHSVPWSTAVHVAELARACRAPDWDLGPQRMVPRAWGRQNQHGHLARSEVLEVCGYVSARRGRVRREVMWTPVTIAPTAARIAAARRGYLDWWGALLAVLAGLRGVDLDLFTVSEVMPPMTPWRKGA